MTTNQTRDILVAEMLGDIGKLHDQVAELKVELPKILNQMQVVINAQTAKADVLQEPVQRAIQTFIRQEIKAITVAVKEAKATAVNSLDVEISGAVRNNMEWAQSKCNQSFNDTAEKFNTALAASVGLAEEKAVQTLIGLCQGLEKQIFEIRAERWKGQYQSMLGACTSTGVVVALLAIYILK